MNLDFCFLDADERVIATGWGYERDLELELHGDGGAVQPISVIRHARQDLRTSEPLGWVAIFRLPVPEEVTDEPGTMFVKLGSDFREVSAVQLFEDEERLVDIGVDEVFFTYLRLIAARGIATPSGKIVQMMRRRMRARLQPPGEKMDLALSVDRCLVAPQGQGVVLGWYLPGSAPTEAAVALAMDEVQLAPVMLLPGSLPRADLQPYSGRYRFTGRDGYCGAFSFAAPVEGAVQVVFLPQSEDPSFAIGAAAEPGGAGAVARTTIEASMGLSDAEARQRLRSALLPPHRGWDERAVLRSIEARAPATASDDPVLLIVDHDLPDPDLRDVLRNLLSQLQGRVALHLLRDGLTPVLDQAALGAAHEAGEGRLSPATAALSIQRQPAREVIFARSSALFQIGLPDHGGEGAGALSVVDPIGALIDARGVDLLGRFDRDVLPFVARLDGEVFFRLLDLAPRGYLTEEARVRALLLMLAQRSAIEVRRADLPSYFVGKGGPHAELFPDGGDWHAYDAEGKKLMSAGIAQ
ncbi:hypothetical protein [Halodurantibacterium flavum]|uniref:Uncharacterized protein n=1 Tax=Halodurantibacterium flavum TaxID=1382802 RepID=A0ABW4S3Z4_9RHOB